MSTLLLALVGPMQSWGIQSHFTHRDTGLEPSKSGVLGLLCAALGKPRDEDHPANAGLPTLAQLAELRMGVRLDRPGMLKRDYHTAGKGGVWRSEGGVADKDVIVSERFYLADAAFLVGLEGDAALLARLDRALQNPHWALFLGRKAFVPSLPPWLPNGLSDDDLVSALMTYPWLGGNWHEYGRLSQLRLVLEANDGEIVRPDQPLSFVNRRFNPRRVQMSDTKRMPPFHDRLADLLG